jgi:hypothetical protein
MFLAGIKYIYSSYIETKTAMKLSRRQTIYTITYPYTIHHDNGIVKKITRKKTVKSIIELNTIITHK